MLCKTRYDILSPIRILLPFSVTLFLLPIFIQKLRNFIYLPIIYFFASYFVLINFPCIIESLHKTPLYIEDLEIKRGQSSDKTFQKIYNITMGFILSLIFAGISEYVLIRGIENKPVVEISAIIWANLSLFIKIQNETGKILLKLCYSFKENDTVRKRFTDETIDIELNTIKKSKSESSLQEIRTI